MSNKILYINIGAFKASIFFDNFALFLNNFDTNIAFIVSKNYFCNENSFLIIL